MDDNTDHDSDNEFQFETDHLALRGNKDYCELLKYIVKLEAQKVQTLKDIEDLVESKNRALNDPLKFLQDLQSETLVFPTRQSISNIPQIEWSKYGLEAYIETDDRKNIKTELDDGMIIRGRKFTENKPETFNQLWSCEEQTRLEELLVIYPEEPIEARRYRKIAQALGTRTTVQVMSRVQKYFAKLAKAGLPIPGRQPKGIGNNRSKSNIFYKKSTFFPQLHVPVKMDDPNDIGENEIVPYSDSFNGNKAMELLKTAKEQRLLDEMNPIWQTDILCVGCNKKSFLGARWTDNAGTDYCTDCVVRLLPDEKLIPIRN